MFELGLSKATLSHHFRVLRESGVVRTRPEGRKRLLSLRTDDLDARFPGLLGAVLSAKRRRAKSGAYPGPPRARRAYGSSGTRTQSLRINLPHRLSPATRRGGLAVWTIS